ncbi:hypothetical protein WJX79_005527 [Trebouxia sp. C0005]
MPERLRKSLPDHNFVNSEAEILASDLADIAVNTDQKITFQQAQQAHLHLNVILRHFILAARAAGHAAELSPSTPPPTSKKESGFKACGDASGDVTRMSSHAARAVGSAELLQS